MMKLKARYFTLLVAPTFTIICLWFKAAFVDESGRAGEVASWDSFTGDEWPLHASTRARQQMLHGPPEIRSTELESDNSESMIGLNLGSLFWSSYARLSDVPAPRVAGITCRNLFDDGLDSQLLEANKILIKERSIVRQNQKYRNSSSSLSLEYLLKLSSDCDRFLRERKYLMRAVFSGRRKLPDSLLPANVQGSRAGGETAARHLPTPQLLLHSR